MKKLLLAAVLAASVGTMGASLAHAQTAQRVYDQGTVWSISQLETKPGMFDDYMAYLNGTWRSIQEARKKTGDVVSYRILTVNDPRDHEPDVILMVEYKNMAVFDRSLDDIDKQAAAAFGSTVKANQAAISREAMRTPRGGLLAREVKFTK
jgi:hypothetical protein